MSQTNLSTKKSRLGFLNSSIRPSMIFISGILGLYTGIIPGFSGLHFIAIALLLLLNLNIAVFLSAFILGLIFEFAGASLFYHIGFFIAQNHPDLLTTLKSTPLLALGDYNRYCFTGAMMVGFIPAFIWGLIITLITRKMIKNAASSDDINDKPGALMTIANLLIAGKKNVTPDHLVGAKRQILRNSFIVVCAIIIISALLLVRFVAGNALVAIAENNLGQINKAQVDIGQITLFPIKGKIEITHIAVTDSKNLNHNAVYVKHLYSNLNRFALLTGQIILDDIIVSNITFNTERETPGKVYHQPTDDNLSSIDLSGLHTKGKTMLGDYLAEPEKFYQFIETVKNYLPEKKSAEQIAAEAAAATEEAKANANPLVVGYRHARSYAANNTPRIIVRRIALEQVNVPLTIIGNADVTAINISDYPEGYPHPMIITAQSNDHDITVALSTIFQQEQFLTTINGELVEIDLKHVQNMLANSNGIVFERGTLTGKILGSITKNTIDMQLSLALNKMVATAGKKGILGLDKSTSNRILEVLDTLNVIINISGAIDNPTISFNKASLEKQFNKALEKAGKKAIEREVNKEINKALDKIRNKENKYQITIDKLTAKQNRGEKLTANEQKALKRARKKIKKNQIKDELIDSALKGLGDLFK